MWIAFLPRVALGTDTTLTRLRANALLNNTMGSSNITIGDNAGSLWLPLNGLFPQKMASSHNRCCSVSSRPTNKQSRGGSVAANPSGSSSKCASGLMATPSFRNESFRGFFFLRTSQRSVGQADTVRLAICANVAE
jgi:hypothetical protein